MHINGNCHSVKICDTTYNDLPAEYSKIEVVGLIDKRHIVLENPIIYVITKLTDEDESTIEAELYLNGELLMFDSISNHNESIEFVVDEL